LKREQLIFDRPEGLAATVAPEDRKTSRSQVRLLVSSNGGHEHASFADLPRFLKGGDVLLVNESATIPASLPAVGHLGSFLLNLSTRYADTLWLSEPRWSAGRPGPLPFTAGDRIVAAGIYARLVSQYPGIPRLWFVAFDEPVEPAMAEQGKPIRYGYLDRHYPLSAYQTIFSRLPGSAEMPSAGRPFTATALLQLAEKGVDIRPVLLHTGVSSLEVESEVVEEQVLYPEPFWVPQATAHAVNHARAERRRVIAVGTTAVRAIESSYANGAVHAQSGFTRTYIHPARGLNVVDGLVTGFHDPVTSHLAMLFALAGEHLIRSAYREAVAEHYFWHEFGDSHLIIP
jgi:S-adenosylmethionine:tRNA ribosyltransferase-isomerase